MTLAQWFEKHGMESIHTNSNGVVMISIPLGPGRVECYDLWDDVEDYYVSAVNFGPLIWLSPRKPE